jgi:hypothetical protein
LSPTSAARTCGVRAPAGGTSIGLYAIAVGAIGLAVGGSALERLIRRHVARQRRIRLRALERGVLVERAFAPVALGSSGKVASAESVV